MSNNIERDIIISTALMKVTTGSTSDFTWALSIEKKYPNPKNKSEMFIRNMASIIITSLERLNKYISDGYNKNKDIAFVDNLIDSGSTRAQAVQGLIEKINADFNWPCRFGDAEKGEFSISDESRTFYENNETYVKQGELKILH